MVRRAASEAIGTALLLAVVVGSGMMGERLANGNVAIALLANTLATGAGLVALILTFGPISGAHFNPVVTVADAWEGNRPWNDVPTYIAAQVLGALLGVALAHGMFDEPLFAASQHVRSGPSQLLSEFVATFGLLSVIWGVSRSNAQFTPFAVGSYITAAYWFTSSTSFANPAVTLARSLTNTFSGIRPIDTLGFIGAQVIGALAATALFRFLAPAKKNKADVPIVADRRQRERMKTVLFACIHNAGRSQMAAAWFNALADQTKARALSAGTEPGARVHPEVLQAMKEVGIDLSHVEPRKLTDELAADSAILVTLGCGEQCPHVPGLRHLDWPLEDPKGKPVERVREIREEVKGRVANLLRAEGWQ